MYLHCEGSFFSVEDVNIINFIAYNTQEIYFKCYVYF